MTLVDQLGWSTHRVDIVLGAGLLIALRLHPDGIAGLGRRRPRTAMLEAVPHRPAEPLAVDGVSVRFGGVRAVNAVDLLVNPCTVVGLVGPNGAGKTTLLDAISGFTPTDSGDIRLGTSTLNRLGPHRRTRLGVARTFQGLELFEDLTVGENIALAAEGAGHVRGSAPHMAVAALRRFGLEEVLDRRPAELPHGVRRTVALVRALASDPAVILLDEPAAGLRTADTRELAAEIRRLADEAAVGVLLIDHDMSLMLTACDSIVVLDQGTVIAAGEPETMLADPRVRAVFLGAPLAHGEGEDDAGGTGSAHEPVRAVGVSAR